jgi:hypothetical protein
MMRQLPPDYPVVAGINPKPRSPKSEGSPNAEVRSDCCAGSPAGLLTRPNPARLRFSDFGFPSALGFRPSDLKAAFSRLAAIGGTLVLRSASILTYP